MSDIEKTAALNKIVNETVAEIIEEFKTETIVNDEIAVTLIDLRDSKKLQAGNFNGEQKIYPASVVKLFYLAAVHRRLEDGKIKTSPELERGLRDMIVDSSNDATHYIVDVLTGTSGGAELSGKEFENYSYRRNAVNLYFQTLGFENINVNQKTYCEDLYGRERQFWDGGKNRNMLTTDAAARLLTEIALGKMVSTQRSSKMLELLKRDPYKKTAAPDDQNTDFIGAALKNISGVKLWSKAGWTSSVRHDAAYFELPSGEKFVLVIFTQNHSGNRRIIPAVADKIIKKITAKN